MNRCKQLEELIIQQNEVANRTKEELEKVEQQIVEMEKRSKQEQNSLQRKLADSQSRLNEIEELKAELKRQDSINKILNKENSDLIGMINKDRFDKAKESRRMTMQELQMNEEGNHINTSSSSSVFYDDVKSPSSSESNHQRNEEE